MKSFTFRDENGKFYFGWWIVLAAAIFCGLVYSGIVSVTGVFLMPVTQSLGLPVAGYSFYITIMSLTNIVTLLFISKYLNERNIKKIMIVAGILGIVSFIGFAMAKSLMWFYIFAIPQGFCFGAFTMTPCQILVSNWFGEKARGRAMSIFLAIMSIITVILMNALNYVILSYGWRTGYVILAVCVAICVLIAFKAVVWSPAQKGIKRVGDLDESEMAAMQQGEVSGIGFAAALKKPITWLAFISCTLAVIVSSSILQHGIATMVIGGISQTKATALISTMSLVMIVTGPIIGIICDKFRLSVAAAGTALFFALAVFGLAYTGTAAWGTPVFMIGYMFGVPAINIISPLMMSHMYGEKELGRLIGYVNVFVGIGGAIGATAVGVLYQTFGAYHIPWLIMTGVLVVVAIIRGICTSSKRKYTELKEQ
ncbi:MFS transporter [Anaerovorax odorimutans]|uniref:MFS transporter n=1 Tax=Anaerovorax odorimutans TaxID=109327 RepID=A0ABT1RLZ8_9FIRM|nr:MFS transporter [Anaerovorax odorimutans]MCQ4636203.1 MFS transporter [Anaerovorax odorimutans]